MNHCNGIASGGFVEQESRSRPPEVCIDCGAPAVHQRCAPCQLLRNEALIDQHRSEVREAFANFVDDAPRRRGRKPKGVASKQHPSQ